MGCRMNINLAALCKQRDIMHIARSCNVKLSEIAEILDIDKKEVIKRISRKGYINNKWEIVYVVFALVTGNDSTAEILADVWVGDLYLKLDCNGAYLVIDCESGETVAKISLKTI